MKNTAKYDRIQEIIRERDLLANQLEVAHNFNLLLTNTVDVLNADENDGSNANVQRIQTMEREIADLRARVIHLNRQNFELENEKNQLKVCLATFSVNIQNEHNYNL